VHTEFWWENPREREHFERPGHWWEDNIKMDLQKVGWGGMDWITVAQDRDRWRLLVDTVTVWFHNMRGIF
jgi:hypothetical protein